MNESIHRHSNMMNCYDADAVKPSEMIIRTDKNVDNMSVLGSCDSAVGGEYSGEDYDDHDYDGKMKSKNDDRRRTEEKRGDTVVINVLDEDVLDEDKDSDDQDGRRPTVTISENADDGIIVSRSTSDIDLLTNAILSPTISDKWDMDDGDGNDGGNGNGNGNGNNKRNIDANDNDADGNISIGTSKAIVGKVSRPKGPRRAMSGGSVSKDESKLKKIGIRLASGFSMAFVSLFFVFQGHVYICALIFLVEILLFRELVKVRYNTFFHIIEETIPLFRTTQWLWFVTSIFYTCSDFIVEVIKSNTSLHYLLNYAQLFPGFAFLLYSGTFVITIATMQKDHIRFQINQLCWTILVLCLTVGQLKYIMHNVYNGLIWFMLPIMLVVSNDSFAWLAGITCGRKFIHREFIRLSPNKTWEGFIGGWIGSMFTGWYLSYFMAQYTWMICPNNDFSLFPEPLECEPNPIFHKATGTVPSQIFELFPQNLLRMIPTSLAARDTGDDGIQHDHFEMVLTDFYPVQIHALGLSLFASFVAPFGGFLASAIKRAYAIKDFDSLIPGHGGMMDRFDCQLLMALCTWVHYNTFVSMATISVPKMLYMYNLLNENEQGEFLRRITELSRENGANILSAP